MEVDRKFWQEFHRMSGERYVVCRSCGVTQGEVHKKTCASMQTIAFEEASETGDWSFLAADPGRVFVLPEPANKSTKVELAYDEIFERIAPAAIERFRSKTKDYRGGPAFQFLGSKGQFADMNRKFWKLYLALWKGQELTDESVVEVCEDMIGHLLLTIYCVENDNDGEGEL